MNERDLCILEERLEEDIVKALQPLKITLVSWIYSLFLSFVYCISSSRTTALSDLFQIYCATQKLHVFWYYHFVITQDRHTSCLFMSEEMISTLVIAPVHVQLLEELTSVPSDSPVSKELKTTAHVKSLRFSW